MHKRIAKITGSLLALGALALGGSALATANSPATTALSPTKVAAPEAPASAKDADTQQQGDKTTPDAATAGVAAAGDSSDSGAAAPENAPENASETGVPSDGLGGHADGPGNVDHQSSTEQ